MAVSFHSPHPNPIVALQARNFLEHGANIPHFGVGKLLGEYLWPPLTRTRKTRGISSATHCHLGIVLRKFVDDLYALDICLSKIKCMHLSLVHRCCAHVWASLIQQATDNNNEVLRAELLLDGLLMLLRPVSQSTEPWTVASVLSWTMSAMATNTDVKASA